jgi:p-cumate 2,3-dioxygenase subunit beta
MLSRVEIEDFLFHEAALLNEWRLEEWLELFAEEGAYLVPNVVGDPYASPESTLYFIADDRYHLSERVKRLGKKTAHAEQPRSATRRLVSNVRILARNLTDVRVEASFATYRTNQGVTDVYFGRHEYVLVERGDVMRILEKRTILDTDALRPQGRLSIIV